jgi:arsenate reductase-like glutaredoxin family protein
LAHSNYTDERWLEKLSEEPLLLKMPLARAANRLTIGLAETEWRSWLTM